MFPLASLHHITAGLMRHLRWNGRPQVNLFRDCDFHDFRASLNAEIKKLQRERVGAKKRQAEVLTEANEELMRSKGLPPRRHHSIELARHSYLLQRTVFFCIEEWEGAPTAGRLTLSNTCNRTPRREALSSLHRRHL